MIVSIYSYIYIHTNKFILVYKNRLKERNCMIILIHAEKALEKVWPFFAIKVLKKLGIEKSYYFIKDFINKAIANIMLSGETLGVFPLKLEQDKSGLSPLIQYWTGSLN